MSTTSGIDMINGMVQLDGKGIANQLVLLLSSNMDQFIGSTATDDEGRYSIALPSVKSTSSVVLVAKIQGPVLALDYRVIQPGLFVNQQDFNIHTSSEAFCMLRAGIVADHIELPPFLEIAITPVHLDGIPSVLEQFFLRRSNNVVDASYYQKNLQGTHFELKMQRGSYRISGGHINYKGPDSVLPAPDNFIVGSILADGENNPLPGERLGGYLLEIKHDRKIDLKVEVFNDKK